MNYRTLRVANLIQKELSKIILKELEFENALPTITKVDLGDNLETAEVKVSVIPSSQNKPVLEKLNRARDRLQWLLMKKINIKPMPKIRFEIDRGPENAARVEKIILENVENN
jgi:ribosome-binding factor A